MDPSYIYFQEIDIDQDSIFTADFSKKKNEIEDVAFDKENEYAVTSLTINSILPAEKILKIKNVKEEKKIREEIQELIKKYKEPDLTLVISHPEMLTVKIPFVKKNETDLPKLKLTYFNTNAEKNEDFLKYDYIGHLENFGFEWAMNEKNFDFKYEIKIDSSDNIKLIKKIYLSKYARNLLQNDESRIWNMLPTWIENH